MANNYIIRRFELILGVVATAGFLINALLYGAERFEDLIELAREGGVPVRKILQDLVHYDHTWNHNMPMIVSAVMLLIAWYLFHYMFFPKIKEGSFQATEFAWLMLVVGLVISGTFILLNTIEIVPRADDFGMTIGLHDATYFRKLFVLSDSIAIFTVICVYEILSQLYYKLYEKLEIESTGRILNYIIAFLICGLAFMMVVSQRWIPAIFVNIGARQFLAIILFGITVFCLQEYYFRKVYGILHGLPSSTTSHLPVFIYFLILGLGTGLITASLLRFFYMSLSSHILLITGLYVCSFAIAYYRKSQQKEKTELATQISGKSAELTNLRAQINPHFLFNTLNTLYATALAERSEKTADGIQKLGDMMRFMLHENHRERIPLQNEIAYLRNYMDIQRMRLDETNNIEIRINIQEPVNEVYLAPMLLSPFIENAFKHGISLLHPSWIYITLTLDADHIYFKVHNSLHLQTGNDPEKMSHGIGLENEERRLKLIYPGRYNMHIQKSAQDYFASLTLSY